MKINTTSKRQVLLSLQCICIFTACTLFLIDAIPYVANGTQDSKHLIQREDFGSHLRVLNETFEIQCRRILSTHTQEYVTCCGAPRKQSVRCLPTFIIAGVQKAGTTALSAMLCSHPSISFSKKKEVHFFDNLKRYNLGISEYLHNFHEWDASRVGASLPIYGESTPYYLASRDACRRISETIPEVKLVVLLREPVSRAYSEYQMKKRRVAAQNEFIELAIANSRILSYCFNQYKRQWASITQCLPSSITAHSHYNKLLSSLKSKARKPHRQQKERQEYHPKSADKNKNEYHNENKNGCKSNNKSENENENENESENENENEDENLSSNRTDSVSSFNSKLSTDKRTLKVINETARSELTKRKMKKLKPIPKKTFSTNLSKYGQSGLLSDGSTFLNTSDIPQQSIRSTNKIMHTMNNSTSHCNIQESEKTAAALLWIKQLLGRNLPEHLVPLDDAFGNELRSWEECSGSLIGAGMTLDSLDAAVEKCLVKKKGIQVGISSQFFYRSLYAVQLYNCFKYVSRERVFVVSAQRLRNHQESTLDSILHFIGLPHNPTVTYNLNLEQTLDMGASTSTGYVKDMIDGHYQHPNKDKLNKEATALYHHQSTVSDSMKLIRPQTSEQQSDLISAAVNTYFPSFGTSTGWQLKSEYEDLPKGLMADLVRFFRPYNALLSGLLGDDSFEKEWTLDS